MDRDQKETAMSLLCAETGGLIEFGTELWAVTRGDMIYFQALSAPVLECVLDSEKRPEPCQLGEGGVDIHVGTSTRNFTGSYSWLNFAKGKFLYSLSQESAEEYLPHLIQLLPAADCG
jgi:hypothetical protein